MSDNPPTPPTLLPPPPTLPPPPPTLPLTKTTADHDNIIITFANGKLDEVYDNPQSSKVSKLPGVEQIDESSVYKALKKINNPDDDDAVAATTAVIPHPPPPVATEDSKKKLLETLVSFGILKNDDIALIDFVLSTLTWLSTLTFDKLLTTLIKYGVLNDNETQWYNEKIVEITSLPEYKKLTELNIFSAITDLITTIITDPGQIVEKFKAIVDKRQALIAFLNAKSEIYKNGYTALENVLSLILGKIIEKREAIMAKLVEINPTIKANLDTHADKLNKIYETLDTFKDNSKILIWFIIQILIQIINELPLPPTPPKIASYIPLITALGVWKYPEDFAMLATTIPNLSKSMAGGNKTVKRKYKNKRKSNKKRKSRRKVYRK